MLESVVSAGGVYLKYKEQCDLMCILTVLVMYIVYNVLGSISSPYYLTLHMSSFAIVHLFKSFFMQNVLGYVYLERQLGLHSQHCEVVK